MNITCKLKCFKHFTTLIEIIVAYSSRNKNKMLIQVIKIKYIYINVKILEYFTVLIQTIIIKINTKKAWNILLYLQRI